jgi:hypothetical protein
VLNSGGFTVVGDTTIQITNYVPSTLGDKSVTVTTPLGTSNALVLGFTVADPPILFAPTISNNGGNFTLTAAGGANWTALLSINTTFSTFSFNGATWLSALILQPMPPLDAVGVQTFSVPLSGVPAGLTINTQYWLFPPGATSADDAKVTNIGATLNLF